MTKKSTTTNNNNNGDEQEEHLRQRNEQEHIPLAVTATTATTSSHAMDELPLNPSLLLPPLPSTTGTSNDGRTTWMHTTLSGAYLIDPTPTPPLPSFSTTIPDPTTLFTSSIYSLRSCSSCGHLLTHNEVIAILDEVLAIIDDEDYVEELTN